MGPGKAIVLRSGKVIAVSPPNVILRHINDCLGSRRPVRHPGSIRGSMVHRPGMRVLGATSAAMSGIRWEQEAGRGDFGTDRSADKRLTAAVHGFLALARAS